MKWLKKIWSFIENHYKSLPFFLYKLLPLFVVLGLFGAYVFSNVYFVNCGGEAGCKQIESENISAVPSAIKRNANTNVNTNVTANANLTNQAGANSNKNSNKNSDSGWKNLPNTKTEDIAAYCSEIVDNTNRVKPDKVDDLNCTASVLAEKKLKLDEKDKAVKSQQDLIDKLDENLTKNREEQIEKAGEANTANTANTDIAKTAATSNTNTKIPPTLEANENTMMTQRDTRVKMKDEAANNRQAVVNEIGGVRGQIADRYAKRLVFMFMTAAFILLCLAAIFFSIYVIADTFKSEVSDANEVKKKKRWKMEAWLGFTIGGALALFVFAWNSQGEYLSIVIPMFKQSITANGDISLYWIHFFNCLAFGTIIMIVGAAGAIFFKVVSERETVKQDETVVDYLNTAKEVVTKKLAVETDLTKQTELTAEIADLQNKIIAVVMVIKNKFLPYRQNITRILYIGAAMLFVGIVRVKLLADWHLLFVSKDYSALLAKFFDSSISVQAAFYSILLAVVFLPVILAIPTPDADTAAPTQNWFQRLGLPITSENVAKFVAVFSPMLATPIVGFLQNFFGKVG